jgi:hypothetical protein
MKYGVFCGTAWRPDAITPFWGFWFRVCGYGLSVSTKKRSMAFFSERYGYTKPLYVLGLRFLVLTPTRRS